MKRTQVKDTLRNIWKQKVSYLSIVVIAFLAVTAYVGIDLGAEALRRGGSSFYEETNFRDEEIISTLLLTETDIEAIRAVDGVADVEGVYQTTGSVTHDELHESVSVLSLTQRINLPQVVSGRLPASSGECAVEQPVMEKLGLSVGDRIEITDTHGETAAYLRGGSFVITGAVLHPDHMAWPDMVPGDRYILILPEDFDLEALDGCYMKAEIELDKPDGMGYYDADYLAALADTEARLSALADERAPIRYDEVHGTYQAELDDGKTQLDDAKSQLDDARTELDDGWEQLADGEQELADGEAKLLEAEEQLAEVWQQLSDAQAELADAEAQLASAKTRLDSGAAELRSAEAQLASARSELLSSWEQLEDAKETIRNMIRSGVESAIGSEAAAAIPWASRQSADLSSSGASASEFWITDSVRFDMSLSLQDNIMMVLTDSGIPDETLIRAYETLTGGGDQ